MSVCLSVSLSVCTFSKHVSGCTVENSSNAAVIPSGVVHEAGTRTNVTPPLKRDPASWNKMAALHRMVVRELRQ